MVECPAGHAIHTTFGDGHVYVVFFTASWCGPCQAVYPVLDTVLKQFAARGVRAIYGDASRLTDDDTSLAGDDKAFERVRQYYAEHHVTSPVASFNDMYALLESGYFDFSGGNANLPLVVVIDGAGRVRDQQSAGDALQQQLVDDITKLTQAPPTQGNQ